MFDERARWAFVDSHDGVQSFGLYIPAASASSQSLPALQLPCPITIIPSKRRKESERPIPLPVKEMQPVSFTRPRRHRLHDYRTDGDLTKNEVTFLKEEYKRRSVQQYTSPGASLDAHAYRVPFKDKESKGKSLCAPLLTATGKDCVDCECLPSAFMSLLWLTPSSLRVHLSLPCRAEGRRRAAKIS